MPKLARQNRLASSSTRKAFNPLNALLREKRAADKRGTSSNALRLAENAVRQECHREPSKISSHDPLFHLGFMDEQAAWRAIRHFQASNPPQKNHTNTEDYALGPRQTRMLGSEAGAAISKILANDRIEKGKERARVARREKALGVPLWKTESSEDMDVDFGSILTDASFGQGSLILDLINQLHRTSNDAQLALLLESGAVINLPPQQLTALVSSLLAVGLFSSARVANAAHNALRDVYTACTSEVVLSFSVICTALVQLGARSRVFEQVGWKTEGCPQDMHLSSEIRSEVLFRLVAVIKLAATSTALTNHEVADHVLSLVLIGLDNSTCHVLRAELNAAIDAICVYNATDLATRVSIHARVLGFASKLNPVNKARLVTVFSSGGPQTRHIAQWLAYCLLTSSSVPLMDQPPPLDPLIHVLSPRPGCGQVFDVTCENTDYEDLGHYVSILGVALTDIASYVKNEPPSAPRQSGIVKDINTPLEQLRIALEVIHGKIVDTRAAHLDRSRVKATLQHLTMRLCFEHRAIKGPQRISTLR